MADPGKDQEGTGEGTEDVAVLDEPLPAERTLEDDLDKSLAERRTYGEEGSLPKKIPQPEVEEKEEDHPVMAVDTDTGLIQLTRAELEEKIPEPDTGDLGDYVTALDPIKARAQSAEAHAKLEALEEVESG